MNRAQKRALALRLLEQAGDLVEFFGEYLPELAEQGVTPEQVAEKLALWLRDLPGDVWDTRLPTPLT